MKDKMWNVLPLQHSPLLQRNPKKKDIIYEQDPLLVQNFGNIFVTNSMIFCKKEKNEEELTEVECFFNCKK